MASLPGGAPPRKRNWAPLMIGGTLVVVIAGLAFAATSLGSGGGSDEPPPTVSDIITTSSTATTAAPEARPDVTPTSGPLPTEVVTVVEPGQAGQYTVRPGDTLSNLARGFGVPLRALAEANGIPNWDLIHPGEVLVIPEVPD